MNKHVYTALCSKVGTQWQLFKVENKTLDVG